MPALAQRHTQAGARGMKRIAFYYLMHPVSQAYKHFVGNCTPLEGEERNETSLSGQITHLVFHRSTFSPPHSLSFLFSSLLFSSLFLSLLPFLSSSCITLVLSSCTIENLKRRKKRDWKKQHITKWSEESRAEQLETSSYLQVNIIEQMHRHESAWGESMKAVSFTRHLPLLFLCAFVYI